MGINRSYLSQFESGKYLFDDATLTRLHDYYSKPVAHSPVSAQFDNDPEEEDTPRLRDGFLLSQELDDNHADTLLSEYEQNRHRINDICSIDLSNSGFLGFGVEHDLRNKKPGYTAFRARLCVIFVVYFALGLFN